MIFRRWRKNRREWRPIQVMRKVSWTQIKVWQACLMNLLLRKLRKRQATLRCKDLLVVETAVSVISSSWEKTCMHSQSYPTLTMTIWSNSKVKLMKRFQKAVTLSRWLEVWFNLKCQLRIATNLRPTSTRMTHHQQISLTCKKISNSVETKSYLILSWSGCSRLS